MLRLSSLEGRERVWTEGEWTRRFSIEMGRVWIGGNELLPDEMLPNEGALKACAKDGRDCGMCVAMLPWLTDISQTGRGKKRTQTKKWRQRQGCVTKVRRTEGISEGAVRYNVGRSWGHGQESRFANLPTRHSSRRCDLFNWQEFRYRTTVFVNCM